MSTFDYIGLTICGLFFIVFGVVAILDLFEHLKPNSYLNRFMIPVQLLIIWGAYAGLSWIYYY